MVSKPSVYNPRVGERGEALTDLLIQNNYLSIHQPLFNITKGEHFTALNSISTSSKTIYIFTSQFAVQYFELAKLNLDLSNVTAIGIGKASSQALANFGFAQVLTPKQAISESLIELCQQIEFDQAFLFKGEAGRDEIANAFKLAKKNLKTYNVYKRVWISIPDTQLAKIKQADVFIITSGEIGLQLISLDNDLFDKLKSTLCLVPSVRVKTQLEQLGLNNVTNINSANNQTIITSLNQIYL